MKIFSVTSLARYSGILRLSFQSLCRFIRPRLNRNVLVHVVRLNQHRMEKRRETVQKIEL